MRNIKRLIAVTLVSVIAIGAAGCNMVSKTEAGIKKSKVATFYSETITKGQLDEKMVGVIAAIKQQYGADYEKNADAQAALKQQKQTMLDNMITESILLKKAKDMKVTPDDKTLADLTTKKVEELKKQYTEDIVKNAGYTGGYADPKFVEFARNSVVLDKLYEEATKDVKIEDKEVSDYYTANPNQFTTEPNKIHVAHILSATEEDAKKVKERLDKGEAFDKVAKEVSTDTSAKDNGGDLGEIDYTDANYDKVFMSAAISQKEGTVSNPVKTSFGWHVIKVIKKTEFPVRKFDEVKADLTKSMLDQKKSAKFQEQITAWKAEAKIKLYDENL